MVEEETNFIKRLKTRWGVDTNWRVFVIFTVFAITGTTAAKLAGPLTEVLNISKDLHPLIYWPIRIIIILPIYKILLLIFGWIFGEFPFFKHFVKKMLRHFGLGFIFK
ncbi:MAG: DUF6787 family protein [Flavobacteriaceae bacterium]